MTGAAWPRRRGAALAGPPARERRSRRGSSCARLGASSPPTVDRVWEVLRRSPRSGSASARRGLRAAHYRRPGSRPPSGCLPRRGAHPRPGMYPKRLILDDARNLGIAILGLDVNRSEASYRVEKVTWWERAPAPGARAGRRPARRDSRGVAARSRPPPRPSRRAALRHPAGSRGRQGHHGTPRSSGSSRGGPTTPSRTSGHRAGVSPVRSSRGSSSPARIDTLYGLGQSPVPVPGDGPRPGDPAGPAAPGRRARTLDPGRHPRADPARDSAGKALPAPSGQTVATGRSGACVAPRRRADTGVPAGRRAGAAPASPRPPRPWCQPGRRPAQLTLDLGDAPR